MAPDQAKRPVEKAPKFPPPTPPLRVKPTFMQKSKYRHLLDDPNVYRWFRKFLRRSPVSAGEHIRRLGWLCEHFALRNQALEVALFAMKPMSERTYVEQALKNGKGITWLGDARIPLASPRDARFSIALLSRVLIT